MVLAVLKKNLLILMSMMAIITAHFAYADIPYVHGLDYFPEHYNGYYDDQNKNLVISDNDIEKDFFVMSQNFDAVRTYEYDPINLQRIIRTAKRYKMKVVVGVGIDPYNNSYTASQISGINKMFEQYPDLLDTVIGVLAGNEVIQGNNDTKNVSYLLEQFNTIAKSAWIQNSKIVLSVSETDDIFASNAGKMLLQGLPEHIPLFVDINPYMAGCSVTAAIGGDDNSCKNSSFSDRWKRLLKIKELNNHQIIVGESGWPTEGPGAKDPIATRAGNLADAVDYYTFLYPFLKNQTINNRTMAIPLFSFAAFDQPMNGIFGFSSNFWGVYNFDSTTKYGMVYPLVRSIKPAPKLGTNLKINLINSKYNDAKMPVLFKTKGNIYSNKPEQDKRNTSHIYSFMNEDDYPYVEYSLDGSNIVTLSLPETGDPDYPAAKCSNELISGNGYGYKFELTLDWARSFSKENNCKYVNWAPNGIIIIGKDNSAA